MSGARPVALLAIFFHGSAALAHDAGTGSVRLLEAWTFDPMVLTLLPLAALLYWRGSRGLRGREGCFAAGLAAVFLALVWPLDVLGEQLFSAHMAQHLLLMNVAAPLLVLGVPLGAMLRGLPLAWRRPLARMGTGRSWRKVWRRLSSVALAALLQQLVLWIWHTPGGIAIALESNALHIGMHASLFSGALLFWTAVLRPRDGQYWTSVAGLLVTLQVMGTVCIVLLLQTGSSYSAYGNLAAAWGLTPAEDEQLGWGLMMLVGTLTYLGAGMALIGRSFALLERSHPGHGSA